MSRHKMAVCLNGHCRSDYIDIGVSEEKYCEQCGAKEITKCPNCHQYIPGFTDRQGIVEFGRKHLRVPNYCANCGAPYPWTSSRIEAAQELIELSSLSEKEKSDFSATVPDILVDTPRTKVATTKFKIYAAKAGSLVVDGLKDLLVDAASEAAKKAIWGA